MYVLLLISLLVLGLVAHAHGFLIGLAAGVGTFAGLVVLVLLLGQWAKKQQPPAPYTSPEPEPPQDTADLPSGWEAVASRDSDRTLPRDRLPRANSPPMAAPTAPPRIPSQSGLASTSSFHCAVLYKAASFACSLR